MRRFALLVAICALSQTTAAQTPQCKSIADAGAQLACYDRAAAPPLSSAKPAPQTAGSKADGAKYVDSISAEDALVNAKLKNICRGC